MGHSCEFRQFESAGGSAVLIDNFFYKSMHQNKTFCGAKTFKNKNYTFQIFFKAPILTYFWLIFEKSQQGQFLIFFNLPKKISLVFLSTIQKKIIYIAILISGFSMKPNIRRKYTHLSLNNCHLMTFFFLTLKISSSRS